MDQKGIEHKVWIEIASLYTIECMNEEWYFHIENDLGIETMNIPVEVGCRFCEVGLRCLLNILLVI